jgi:hypothetical protein
LHLCRTLTGPLVTFFTLRDSGCLHYAKARNLNLTPLSVSKGPLLPCVTSGLLCHLRLAVSPCCVTLLCHLAVSPCCATLLVLQNFFPGQTAVTIGALPCTNVAVTDAARHTALTCTAPKGPGFGNVQLRVTVTGGGNASVPFLYTPPSVAGVHVAAVAADSNENIVVTGSNLGLRNSGTSPDPVVYLGGTVCFQPIVNSSTEIRCTALEARVGAYPVIGAWLIGNWIMSATPLRD